MRVLIADDHTLVRRGMHLLLSKLYPEIEVVEAADADGALAAADAAPEFDLVLCDLALPGMEQLRGLQALHRRLPDVPVVILSAISNPDEIVRTIELGARGYVLKSASDDTFRHALSLVLSGEIYLPSERSEEHTSELQSLMRISYAVFCLKKKTNKLIHEDT